MHVKIIPSPRQNKKFRAILQDGTTVDFGATGYSDYTKHKDPTRMRSYVLRHGGRVPKSTRAETDPQRIHQLMLKVGTSEKQKWGKTGIHTPGFWARWYLWSHTTYSGAKNIMRNKFDIHF